MTLMDIPVGKHAMSDFVVVIQPGQWRRAPNLASVVGDRISSRLQRLDQHPTFRQSGGGSSATRLEH